MTVEYCARTIEEQECPICFEPFSFGSGHQVSRGEKDKLTTAVYHIFHSDCLIDWLKRDATCPSCRISLNLSDVKALTSWKGKIIRVFTTKKRAILKGAVNTAAQFILGACIAKGGIFLSETLQPFESSGFAIGAIALTVTAVSCTIGMTLTNKEISKITSTISGASILAAKLSTKTALDTIYGICASYSFLHFANKLLPKVEIISKEQILTLTATAIALILVDYNLERNSL